MFSRVSLGTAALAYVLVSAAFAGKEFPANPGEVTRADEYVVRLKDSADPAAVLGSVEHVPLLHLNAHLLKHVPSALVKQLAQQPLVEYIEPNRVRHTMLAAPNDPSYASQWALQTVRAAQAWSLVPNRYFTATTIPAGRVRVAVIDTGVDCTHPDFMNASGTSADSAAGGQINFTLSYAFVQTTVAGAACAWFDDAGHGTHTAGTVAASTQNGQGVAALGYPVELIIYKGLDSNGSGDDVTLSNAIMKAADAGARVVSMSLGGAGYSQSLQDAINYAWQRNTLVVAAAGNSNVSTLTFPAGANHAIGVAASDSTNNRASFSNYGSYVDIAAPGVSILSTYPVNKNTGGYATLSGTSMATPHVSALAGLVAGTTPNVPMDAVAQRIQQSANSTYANGGWFQDLGYGVIDAASAVGGTLRTATAGGVVGQVATSTGVAVGSATVTIGSTAMTTAADGLFRFSNLSAGSYTMTVSASGYASVTIPVNVVGGADTTSTVNMGVSYGQISGTVTEGGTVQAGLIVEAMSGGLAIAEAITDSQGRYTLMVPGGTYSVQAGAVSAVTTTSAAVAVPAGGTAAMNIALPAMGRIAGTVKDQNGNLLANVAVSIVNSGFTAGAVTDATGTYRSLGVPAGTYTVSASMAGLADAVASNIGVAAGAASTANLQFAPAATTTFTAIRVNAGGGTVIDANGNTWAADSGYNGGSPYSTGAAISGTTTPALYQTERWSSSTLQYSFSVPNGTYSVNLKFAEIYFGGPGQRVFNIQINGSTVQTNFDPFAAAGAGNTAVDRAYTVSVTAGQIVIALVPVVSNPKISAIEISAGSASVTPTPAPSPSTTFTPIRVNAGGGAVTDSNGNIWSADTGFTAGLPYSTSLPIANTTNPAVYQTERWSSSTLQYNFTVPNGTYTVNLKFAEIYFLTAGQRVFNIQINGTTVQTSFDPLAAAGGPNRAIDESYTVGVTNGQISISLVPVISNPKISAIEILAASTASTTPPPSTFSGIRVNAGGSGYTDSTGNVWSADTGFTGGFSYAVSSAIANTTTPVLYQTERWSSTTLTYNFTVPNAAYNVKLKFAEIYFLNAGQRVFNIQINGTTVETNFDPAAAAGGSNTAVDRIYPVSVTNGQISISLVPVVSNPKISAIEIL